MSNQNSNSPPATPPRPDSSRRRASFSPGASFSELFTRSGNTGTTGQPTGTPAFPSAMASVAQSQNRRRVSITTLGLSGSPNQTNPFGSIARRRGSISSSQGSGSPQFEEAVVEEGESSAPVNTPASPFARRVSFGAQALREVRAGSGSNNNGEGFNWSDALRDKAGRAPSIGTGLTPTSPGTGPATSMHGRSASVATVEPPKEMPLPKTQPQRPKPDPTQERILRGDFYMD